MSKTHRVIVFVFLVILLLLIIALKPHNVTFNSTLGILLISALVTIAFISLFIEHYFTSPTDVIAASFSIVLLLTPMRNILTNWGVLFDAFYYYSLVILIVAVSAILLLDDTQSEQVLRNRISRVLKYIAVNFGKGKLLYFALFLFTLLFYVDNRSPYFLILFGYSTFIILINPRKVILNWPGFRKKTCNEIGEITGVQSKNTFLVKLYDYADRPPVRTSDLVEFKYLMDDTDRVRRGLILDTYLLNREQWIKVLSNKQIGAMIRTLKTSDITKKNVVYKIEKKTSNDFIERFVGMVIDGSSIANIRFQYCGKASINEGQLLEVKVRSQTVLYQVVQGLTEIERLEAKNETGFIVGEAIQLGTWDSDRKTFDRYGWVPDVNAPVFIATDIAAVHPEDNEYIVGEIPGTNYPAILNKKEAISHHLAILGVTGAGKSVFARNFLRQLLDGETKVICVDFTKEYAGKFMDLGAKNIIDEELANNIFKAIDILILEKSKFLNQQEKPLIADNEQIIADGFTTAIKNFLQGETKLAIFELPDVSNTEGILEYTKAFFRGLFDIAKNEHNYGKKVCVVLEEAHTVIPEWNFIGIADKVGQSLVNCIGQIALQGRKYDVGFIVIAQRTANVSKTVLTQCNTVIAFQCFDQTSKVFLSNYLPNQMVDAVPNLRFRQAIGVGKGFRANVPVIFEIPEIIEPQAQESNGVQDDNS